MCQSSSYGLLDPFFSLPLIRRELITAVCFPASISAVSWPPADVVSEQHWGAVGERGTGRWKEPVIILHFLDLR